MNIQIRRSAERGYANHGWLEARHSFSFANYYDPRFTGFRDLVVINEDRVQPGEGFGRHGHRDMEIVTYVLEGALQHQDNLGNGSIMKPGDIQRMSAGRGVQHSEFNASKTDLVHLLQIWIEPAQNNITPSYEQKRFEAAERLNQLRLIVSPDSTQGSLKIHQNAQIYASLLEPGKSVSHTILPGRAAWIQVARGSLRINDTELQTGDGAAISDSGVLKMEAKTDSEFLLFDLP